MSALWSPPPPRRRYKTGKLAPKFHPKTLSFARYLRADAPPPPPEKTYWEYKIDPAAIGMYGNDTIGDCTCAAVAHLVMLFTAHSGRLVVPELADVIHMYSAITGYDPAQTQPDGSNPTDTGAAITDVLAFWQTTGLAGHKILAWASIDPANRLHRNQGTYLFGACDVGVQLPASAQDQFIAGQTWDLVPGDAIDGGHDIVEAGYGSAGRNFQSWGKGDQKATNVWDAAYTDEAYIVITEDQIDEVSGLNPAALDMDALVAAMAAVRAL